MMPIRTLLPALLLAIPAAAQRAPDLQPRDCTPAEREAGARCYLLRAPENREIAGGRVIPLAVAVIPAREAPARPDPIFAAYGGPGQRATDFTRDWVDSPLRADRDVVLVDQRGTSRGHELRCDLGGSRADPQGYLSPLFGGSWPETCRRELEGRADLTRYVTADFTDDWEDVRRALGYGKINVHGGSYGSRVVLEFVRRHPDAVRAAWATSILPPAARNPLQHARDSQAALDSVFALCARDARCGTAFPRLPERTAEVFARLRREPARVAIANPATGATAEVTLTADAFAEAMRVLLYGWGRARALPFLLDRAYAGDFRPFAEAGVQNNAALRDALSFGLGLAVVCSEDVPRITEEDIVRETRGTFLGDQRVRAQSAACATWPRRAMPADWADPVRSDVPVLLFSGAYDPATGARWATEVVRALPNGVQVIVPGSHTPWNACVDRITRAFLDRASVRGLDTSCVREIELEPFILSEAEIPADN